MHRLQKMVQAQSPYLLSFTFSRKGQGGKGGTLTHQTLSSSAYLYPSISHLMFRTGTISVPGGAWSACSVSAPRPPETSCFPSLRPNIDTRTVPAAWQGTATGSSYRFIPPSCDLSSVRFRSGRIQNLRVDWKAEQDVGEVHPEGEGSGESPPASICNPDLQSWGQQEARKRWARHCEAWEPMSPAQPQSGKTDKAPNSLGHG